MPIYEYQCNQCHHTFDILQKMSDAPPKECPACGRGPVERLVSAAGFQLKGGGWYVTDFKDKPKNQAKPTESQASESQKAETAVKKTSEKDA